MTDFAADLHRLRSWVGEHGLEITDSHLREFSKYLELLEIWSKKVALVGSAELPLLATKHLADCLFAAAHCPDRGNAADLGSGAGMPGIPIAIVRPELRVDLIESRAKKISFLVQATQKLANARSINRRIESLAGRDYDLATARALASLDQLLPLARPVLRRGARLLAMKSATYQQELDKADLATADFILEATHHYTLPTGEKRSLLIFEAQ